VDRCEGSPTYGQKFAKGWFQVEFAYYLLPTPVGNPDTVIDRSWTDIDASYEETRGSFEQIEEKYGQFILRKLQPDVTDTSLGRSSIFALRFNAIQNIDSMTLVLREIPGVDVAAYDYRYGLLAKVNEDPASLSERASILIKRSDHSGTVEIARTLAERFRDRTLTRLVDVNGRTYAMGLGCFEVGILGSLTPGYYFLGSPSDIGVRIKVE
jgi:hypothetical protein